MEIRHKGTVLCLLIELRELQDHRRHEEDDCQQAEYDTFRQDKTQVKSDGELHRHKGQEADDCRQAAGEDGIDRLLNGVDDRVLLVHSLLSVVHERVKQKDRVVHGCCQLQDDRHVFRQERDGSDKDVRSLIKQDSDAHNQQE